MAAYSSQACHCPESTTPRRGGDSVLQCQPGATTSACPKEEESPLTAASQLLWPVTGSGDRVQDLCDPLQAVTNVTARFCNSYIGGGFQKGLGTKKEETPNFSLRNYAGSRDWLTCAYSVPGSDSEQQERLLHTTPRWHSSQDGAEQPVKRGAGSRQGMARAWDHQVGGCCKNN